MNIYIRRAQTVAARAFEGETIVMSTRDSSLFTLSEVGTVIWDAADGRTPLAEIVRDKVCTLFEVEPETALGEAEAFCRDLAAHGIMVISDQPMDPAAPGN